VAAPFSKFFGRTIGEGAGVAIGTATANVVEPALQELANAAWAAYPHAPLDPRDAARLRARERTAAGAGIDLGRVQPEREAAYAGIRGERFDVLTELERAFPGFGELLTMRRRDAWGDPLAGIGPDEFHLALRHGGIEHGLIAKMQDLIYARLSPADMANAIQQGFVPDEGLLPDDPGPAEPITPPVEVVQLSPTVEAGSAGIEKKRLRVLAQLAGLPPGPGELLEMWRRGIITEAAVEHGIREGHTKTKWTSAFKALRWNLLSAATLVNMRLRGWIEPPEYHDRMRVHGYGAGEADDWYNSAGRPMAPGQAFTAWARGAPHVKQPGFDPGGATFSEDDFARAIRQSDIRPEWAPVLWHIRYAYPSLFQLRGAVQAGFIGHDRALQILKYERYEDRDALALVNGWLSATRTTAKGLTVADLQTEYEAGFLDRATLINELEALGYSGEAAAGKAEVSDARRARTYRTAVMARLQAAYDRYRLTDADAVTELGQLGVVADAATHYVTLWREYRDAKTHELTPAQVKKAYAKGYYDRATAIAELEERGYNAPDAAILLDE
jgi:hypothetical protein